MYVLHPFIIYIFMSCVRVIMAWEATTKARLMTCVECAFQKIRIIPDGVVRYSEISGVCRYCKGRAKQPRRGEGLTFTSTDPSNASEESVNVSKYSFI